MPDGSATGGPTTGIEVDAQTETCGNAPGTNDGRSSLAAQFAFTLMLVTMPRSTVSSSRPRLTARR